MEFSQGRLPWEVDRLWLASLPETLLGWPCEELLQQKYCTKYWPPHGQFSMNYEKKQMEDIQNMICIMERKHKGNFQLKYHTKACLRYVYIIRNCMTCDMDLIQFYVITSREKFL